MKKGYRYILLDADNTLFDFDAAERQALRTTLARRGVDMTGELEGRYLAINRPLWEALHRGEVEQEWLVVERFRRFGASLGLESDPAEWNREYLERLGECGVLLPGAEDFLATLKEAGRVMVLATNGVPSVQRRRLAGSPATPYFSGVFISGEMGTAKPQAAFFETILTALPAPAEETVMVGDTLSSDIQGAINAGLDSIWYSPKGGESSLPTYTVRTYQEMLRVILEGGK